MFMTEFEEILEIEFIDEREDVYDLTVDDTHNFFANDLVVHNCAEIALSAYDSCRLISQNLKNFVKKAFTKDAYFDFSHFEYVTRVAMRLSDDLVDLELEKLEQIIKICDTHDEKELWLKLYNAALTGRRTGLGTHGLADALACLNLAYDSEEALNVIDKIYKTFRNVAYDTSVTLAEERGAFSVFDYEIEKNNAFIQRLPDEIKERMKKFGRRNISILTNAPTGSVSIESQTSSGIEPVFKNSYKRKRKLDFSEKDIKADFTDASGDRWMEFDVYHQNVKEHKELYPEIRELPSFFSESDRIDWKQRVKIQATIQQYLDHSISSTINLPKGTSEETVEELYFLGWKLGLKGITVYVDGSRDGVLTTESTEEEFKEVNAPKRKQTMSCDVHHVSIKGEKFVIFVGLYQNKPFEIFGGLSENMKIPKHVKSGKLNKIASRKYQFMCDDGTVCVDNLSEIADNTHYSDLTRMISLSLRHGANVKFVVEQLNKNTSLDMFSFTKVISRVLKSYIKEDEKVSGGKKCPECNSELVYRDGCVSCKECSWSKC